MIELFSKIDNILELAENVTLLETQIPKAKVHEMEDYIKLPNNYENDVYVDWENLATLNVLSAPLELCKKPKDKFKLYINDDFD